MMSPTTRTRTVPMVRRIALGALSVTALALAGCGSTPDETATASPKPVVTATPATDDQTYPYSRREEFTMFLKTNLDKLNKEIDELSAKIATLSANARADATQKLQDLRDQAHKLAEQSDKVKDATAASWDSVKADASKAVDDLQAGIKKARQWLSDKIAPSP
jgi:uncharacterized protein YicC (UPF0701 family)